MRSRIIIPDGEHERSKCYLLNLFHRLIFLLLSTDNTDSTVFE